MSPPPDPPPPLLTAIDCRGHVHLVIGCNSLANARCNRSIEVGATPKLIAPLDADVHHLLAKRIEDGEVEWIKRSFNEKDVMTLGRDDVDRVVDAVFVTSGANSEKHSLAQLCKRNRIPINTIDSPSHCTFTLLSTHSDGPLQIGLTTSGNGCKLASRIRREIAATLPPNLGAAVARLGAVRRQILDEDHSVDFHPTDASATAPVAEQDQQDEEDEFTYPTSQPPPFNRLVAPPTSVLPSDKTRRARWLAQICEYYPLPHLAALTTTHLTSLLSSSSHSLASEPSTTLIPPFPSPKTPRIILAGSGPGAPSLLTLATHHALLTADTILADKLVPAPVLALVPRRTPLTIARKFPGNADKAQDELLALALAALQKGETVLRLKQGDPFVYGRGGEEVDFFRRHGYEAVVLPGVTSALAAPLCAGIPPTHRGVADQILICTGTGRRGVGLEAPEFVEGRTVVILMALHRVGEVVGGLLGGALSATNISSSPDAAPVVNGDNTTGVHSPERNNNTAAEKKRHWPPTTPCAIIERASLPDQRVVRSTLEYVVQAVEAVGSRPPGLLVLGAACGVGFDDGEVGKSGWVVEEGCSAGLEEMGALAGGFGLGMGLGSGVGLTGEGGDVVGGSMGDTAATKE